MEKSTRSQNSASSFEGLPPPDLHLQSKLRTLGALDSARAISTALALLIGLTVLGLAGQTLRVYNETHVADEATLLPLWPAEFNVRPTVSLVVGSAVVVVVNLFGVLCSYVRGLRTRPTLHTPTTFTTPLLGLTASLIAIIFYYTANASDVSDTFVSWTCRWRAVPMTQAPYWDTLCEQSQAGLYLAVVLVPVEVAGVVLAGAQWRVERYVEGYLGARKTPVLG
ncbi:hypothetical protein B0J18DRAFT_192549 [Chaetomium sp. MPI-SDFR-AT-0129]|nr:hypothetical protein B0J18DRAFT_192549 [Chaetomium sp. MPI-SDFR-AT-0129]